MSGNIFENKSTEELVKDHGIVREVIDSHDLDCVCEDCLHYLSICDELSARNVKQKEAEDIAIYDVLLEHGIDIKGMLEAVDRMTPEDCQRFLKETGTTT